MSRLTDLMQRARELDPELGKALHEEFQARTKRQFGLVFETHVPEWTALPTRSPARGDTVRYDSDPEQALWKVVRLDRASGGAELEALPVKQVVGATAEPATLPRVMVSARELMVYSKFGDDLFPGLEQTGSVTEGGDAPAHAVITAENEHALRLLQYTHKAAVDCIYIDPPYNTGSKDWKYNNNYVGSDDAYRHSKWLSFMQRRLELAKQLLNPENSVLVVTIDEKEFLRLGLLLEQTFPEARIQMVSSVINPNGVERAREFSRVDEYIFFVMLGDAGPLRSTDTMLDVDTAVTATPTRRETVRWERLLRGGSHSARSHSPGAVYPVYIDPETRRIVEVGEVIPPGTASVDAPSRPGLTTVVPLGTDGSEKRWRMTPESLRKLVASGHAKVGAYNAKQDRWSLLYLGTAQRRRITEGQIVVTGRDEHGVVEVQYADAELGHTRSPKTVWNRASHAAGGAGGSNLLRVLMPDRKFPYPKSLYAVEDVLRFFVVDKPDATILDFFAGSGTTAHAVMRLNQEDGGRRRSISVSNNEVGPDEAKALRATGHRPGDPEWERLGICDYITKPRLRAAITGVTSTGAAIKGAYRYNREADMAEGIPANIEFFTLSYEGRAAMRRNMRFKKVAPVLWLRAGQQGPILDDLDEHGGWAVSESYGAIENLDNLAQFAEQVHQLGTPLVFIITDDAAAFTAATQRLQGVQTQQLYEDYLANVRINEKD